MVLNESVNPFLAGRAVLLLVAQGFLLKGNTLATRFVVLRVRWASLGWKPAR
jgi:hypothetical protein